MKKLILLTVPVLLLWLAAVFFKGPVIMQEGNPLRVLSAAAQVELTSAEIAPIAATKLLQKAGPPGPLSRLLAEEGWQFDEQLGSALFYSRNGERLFVMSRMLTTRYMVFELEAPGNNGLHPQQTAG